MSTVDTQAAARLRQAAQTMRREEEPVFDAVSDLLIDAAEDLDAGLWPDDHHVPANALAVADSYLGDPGPLPADAITERTA